MIDGFATSIERRGGPPATPATALSLPDEPWVFPPPAEPSLLGWACPETQPNKLGFTTARAVAGPARKSTRASSARHDQEQKRATNAGPAGTSSTTGLTRAAPRSVMLQRSNHGVPMLLYQMHELARACMAPVTYWAEANARMLTAPRQLAVVAARRQSRRRGQRAGQPHRQGLREAGVRHPHRGRRRPRRAGGREDCAGKALLPTAALQALQPTTCPTSRT